MKHFKNLFLLFKEELHKKSYFKQMLFSYISISCITFIIFASVLLATLQQQYLSDMAEHNMNSIEQAYTFNNSVISDISMYCHSSLEHADVRTLLYSNQYDISTAIRSREIHSNFLNLSSIILSVDFINFMTDTALTNTERLSLEYYGDQELLALLQELPPKQSPYLYYPRHAIYNNSYGTNARNSAQKIISMIYYYSKQGALVVNLDYDLYCSLLHLQSTDNSYEMFLLNGSGTVFATTDSQQFMKDFSSDPLYPKICEASLNKGSFFHSDENGKYTVSYLKSGYNNVTYISLYRHQGIFGDQTIASLICYSLIYLLLTLILSFLCSYVIYNPIRKLKLSLPVLSDNNISSTENKPINDFEHLENVYRQLMQKNSYLSHFQNDYINNKQQQLLWSLMNDTRSSSFSRKDIEELDASFEYLHNILFIVNIEPLTPEQNIELDLPLFKFTVKNVVSELFENQSILKQVDTFSSQVIFVGSFEQYNKTILFETLTQLKQFVISTGLFRLSVGIGTPVQELENLHTAYYTAKTALINGRMNSADCISFYDDLQFISPDEQYYPYETERNIINALKTQSVAECTLALAEFFAHIRSYHYEQIRHHISQLNDALQRFEFTNKIGQLFLELDMSEQNIITLKEVETLFTMRCELDIGALLEIKANSLAKTELISEINAYVEENIYDPNLSVTLIAEKVNLSINYLRNIYKENTGESLTTYIADKKLALICDMLANTDIPIQDISNQLGFTTKNYFFTFFKRNMNMTPTQYRSQHNNNQ